MNLMFEIFLKVARDLIEKDERVMLIFGAAGVAVPKNIIEVMNYYPECIYDVGIMEQAVVSMAAGVSITGMIPFLCSIMVYR